MHPDSPYSGHPEHPDPSHPDPPPSAPSPSALSRSGPSRSAPPHPVLAMDDEDLDAWILARLAMAGVDLSVLPHDAPEAPADQLRILRSARNFLRSTLPALQGVALDPMRFPPFPSPSAYASLATNASRVSLDLPGSIRPRGAG